MVSVCEEDLDMLDEQTKDLVDAAALIEQMMQYANRYRHSRTPTHQAAIDKVCVVYEKYRYQRCIR